MTGDGATGDGRPRVVAAPAGRGDAACDAPSCKESQRRILEVVLDHPLPGVPSMRPHAAALLLLAACSASDGSAATEQATVTDSAGITIVQNHRPVWGEDEGWKVSAEPVLVIADTMATGGGPVCDERRSALEW